MRFASRKFKFELHFSWICCGVSCKNGGLFCERRGVSTKSGGLYLQIFQHSSACSRSLVRGRGLSPIMIEVNIVSLGHTLQFFPAVSEKARVFAGKGWPWCKPPQKGRFKTWCFGARVVHRQKETSVGGEKYATGDICACGSPVNKRGCRSILRCLSAGSPPMNSVYKQPPRILAHSGRLWCGVERVQAFSAA